MTRITFLLIFTLLISFSSSAHALSITANNNLDQIIIALLKQNILDEKYNDNPDIGEKICEVGGGSRCNYVTSIDEALNKLPKHDIDWAWDLVWHCRGIQTGQFAEHTKCAGKSKNDDRWPSK